MSSEEFLADFFKNFGLIFVSAGILGWAAFPTIPYSKYVFLGVVGFIAVAVGYFKFTV